MQTSLEVSTQGKVRRTAYRTPHGETEMITRFDEASQAWHPTRFLVLDRKLLERARARMAEVGQDGIVCSSIGESPLMRWVEWIAGVENAHLLLADYPDEVEALFEAMTHPDLMIRVTGYSAYFRSLSREYRQPIVDRILAQG